MRLSRFAGAIAVVAALVTATAATAKTPFNGDVCGLVSAKQATALGVAPACTALKPAAGPGSTNYVGNWPALKTRGATLQVTVSAYSDPGLLKLAVHNLKQGLNGPPVKVTGIGGGAYEAKGSLAVGIHTTVGKYLVYISLTAIDKPPSSPKVLEPVAKAVVSELQ